jgi:SAM-dependent methyltransferase
MGAWRDGPAAPLALEIAGAIEELREVLANAGFDGDGVRTALGVEGRVLFRSVDVPVHRRRLPEGPLGMIVDLFVLGSSLPLDRAKRAFAPMSLERLEELGLVRLATGELHATVRLVPHDDLLIVSDLPPRAGHEHAPDHVAGVHGPSNTLALLTVRREAGTALDLGTGCGVQAILASRHSGRVVGTDVNARALNFAAFNLRLNGVENVELREGSFFDPVAGSRFDLVVTNPPYVISPETSFLFRDSGLAGDTVSREVVRQVPAFLEEGAYATILASWIHEPETDWSVKPRDWITGSGCDALLLHHGTQDPLTHAASWTRSDFGHDAEKFDAILDRWLEYLANLGAEGIAYGAVILRKREAASNWVRALEMPQGELQPAGEQIQRMFASQDFLERLDGDHDLLAERLVLAERNVVEQRVVLRGHEWSIAESAIRLDEGLGFDAAIDPVIADLLASLDGRPLAELATELADRQKADPEVVAANTVAVMKGLLEAGFVVRADDPPTEASAPP